MAKSVVDMAAIPEEKTKQASPPSKVAICCSTVVIIGLP
jgi:hypothetical protein